MFSNIYRNKKLEIIFQFIIVLITFTGLFLNYKLFNSPVSFLYYTTLSNLFVLLFYFVTVLKKIFNRFKKNNFYYCIKGLILLSISCTMLIYNFLIAPAGNVDIYMQNPLECNLVHLIVPLLVLFECILFEDKQVLKYKYLLYWVLPLIAYTTILTIYSSLDGIFLDGSSFIYPFMDFKNNGYLKCILMQSFVVAVYILIGFIIIFIDNKMKRKNV